MLESGRGKVCHRRGKTGQRVFCCCPSAEKCCSRLYSFLYCSNCIFCCCTSGPCLYHVRPSISRCFHCTVRHNRAQQRLFAVFFRLPEYDEHLSSVCSLRLPDNNHQRARGFEAPVNIFTRLLEDNMSASAVMVLAKCRGLGRESHCSDDRDQ